MNKKQTARNKAGGLDPKSRIKKVGAFNSSRIQAKKTTRARWKVSALDRGVFMATCPGQAVIIQETKQGANLTHCGQGSRRIVRDLVTMYRNSPGKPNGLKELARRDYVTTPEACQFSGLSRASLYRHLKPYKGGQGSRASVWLAHEVKALQERLRASQGAS